MLSTIYLLHPLVVPTPHLKGSTKMQFIEDEGWGAKKEALTSWSMYIFQYLPLVGNFSTSRSKVSLEWSTG